MPNPRRIAEAMSGASTPWSTGLLALVCAALTTIVAVELSGGLPLAPQVTAAAPSVELGPEPALATFEPPPPQRFDEISARPLFAASRRPYEPPVEPEADAPPPVEVPPTALQLIGVVLAEQDRSALVRPEGGDRAIWVREGDRLEGWVIEEITRDRVQLQRDDLMETIALRPDDERMSPSGQ
jgi:general secretion pathway protein N